MEATVEIRNELVRRDSIEELCNHRARAMELARQAIELLREAEMAAIRSAPGEPHPGFVSSLRDEFGYLRWDLPSASDDELEADQRGRGSSHILESIRKIIDRDAWRSLQNLSGLRNLLDTQGHREFEKQLKDAVPEFTVDNCVSTFAALSASAGEIFNRGVVNLFESLQRRYHTNSAFGLTPRVVLRSLFDPWGWNHYRDGREAFIDLDRIFHILDGKRPPEAGCVADVAVKAHKEKQPTFETEYFQGRIFRGNGNVHLKFRRLDLLGKANDILARHYGAAMPDNRKPA